MTVIPKQYHATVVFYLNHAKQKGNEIYLYARVVYKSLKAEISTGLTLHPMHWNKQTKGLINKNEHPDIHNIMIHIESEIKKIEQHRKINQLPVSAKILKDIFLDKMHADSNEGNITKLLPYLDDNIKLMQAQKSEYTKATVNHYLTLRSHLVNYFDATQASDIYLHHINTKFLQEFDDFITTWIHPKLNRAMNRNTANKYHSKLRKVIERAVRSKLMTWNPYLEFKLKRVRPKSTYLIEREIEKVSTHRFENKSLELVRDYLLFSLWTGGLRYSDLRNLKPNHIFKEGAFHFLHLDHQEKTENSVHTPLLPGAVAIMRKYAHQQKATGKVLPKLTQQKLNEYLKTIGDLSGLHKTLTHKVARHTFGTTICAKNGVPRHIIAAWMGHFTQTRTTDIYAQVTKSETNTWLTKLFEQYNQSCYTTL